MQIYLCNSISTSIFSYILVTGCHTNLHVALIVLNALYNLIILLITIIIIFFFSDESPNSKVPWALSNFKSNLLSAFKLFFGPLLLVLTDNDYINMVCMIGLLISDILNLYFHVFFPSYLNHSVQISSIIFNIFTSIYSIYLLILIVHLQ